MGQKLCCTVDPEIYNQKSIEIEEINSKDPENLEERLTQDESKKGQSQFEMASNEHQEALSKESEPIFEFREKATRRDSVRCQSRKLTSISHRPLDTSYDEIGEIGTGSNYCVVWKILHKRTGIERARKSIPKGISCNDREPDINEVNILKELEHPNIIKIYYF